MTNEPRTNVTTNFEKTKNYSVDEFLPNSSGIPIDTLATDRNRV